ncbi:lipocalin family protein [Pedobacter rhodius]|uniref:Lipocalin family protein n=1 Tax=Pedobacter rhodius TaxID=3004098 RepID=A0ABT4KTF1_9SPHI|nr:lipocalin family protein [Pedobacter sp. SJ11]MCZ4222055.1 lipocalin family protein [Pedobacter sp. SJ11]
MKLINFRFFILLVLLMPTLIFFSFKNNKSERVLENQAVAKINFKNFQGTWYSLTSIPTALDKKWRKTVEHYTLKEGHFDVFTTYYKIGNPEKKSIKSKLFFYEGRPNGEMKAQFLWPFKIGYRVIELPDDYSYVVIGHPDKKYLFIMARKPEMDKKLMNAIVDRCKQNGYEVDKLVSQEH